MKLAIIVTCKNRLSHLQQTAPLVIQSAGPGVGYVLVDWGCPEHSWAWIRKLHLPNVEAIRVEAPGFWKTKAQNMGAQAAIRAGAEYLLFADADTLLGPGFFQWLIPNLRPDLFMFVEPSQMTRDISGLLVVPSWAFAKVGGYDEGFRQYGHEDIELRLRLWKVLGLGFGTYNHGLVGTAIRSIPHGDDMRVQNYAEKDLKKSAEDTLHYMIRMTSRYMGDFHRAYNGPEGPIVQFLMGSNAGPDT